MSKLTAYGMLAAMVILSAVSILMFRTQINRMPPLPSGLVNRLIFVVQTLMTPLAVLSAICFGIAFICWTLASTRLPLSVAYPITSLIYPLVVVGSAIAFHEPISWTKMVGLAFIMGGLTLVNLNS
ncbi:hypothetical protein MyNCGM152_18500 [Achromobacter xylosoxidans]|uniref:EamA family transporter n=1 Tax=Alcaligenes xylosoxydans xylosoxydans TaxID=85698 RepID=UPI002A766CCC|nr:EamA family transporter [Achromobacter xylosoxidans]WPQ32771.1 EamA family transporter [Achromobacter xylosoxidans]